MEKVRIYMKREPSGEYGFGEIEKEELIDSGFNFETNEFNDDDAKDEFIDESYNYSEQYGMVLYDGDKYEIGEMFQNLKDKNIDWSKIKLEEESDEDEMSDFYESTDKYFVQYSAPSKYTMEFELNVDVNDFNPELLHVKLKNINYPAEDSYGCIEDYYFIREISYDGVDYFDEMIDSMIDRGYSYQVSILRSDADNGHEVLYTNIDDED